MTLDRESRSYERQPVAETGHERVETPVLLEKIGANNKRINSGTFRNLAAVGIPTGLLGYNLLKPSNGAQAAEVATDPAMIEAALHTQELANAEVMNALPPETNGIIAEYSGKIWDAIKNLGDAFGNIPEMISHWGSEISTFLAPYIGTLPGIGPTISTGLIAVNLLRAAKSGHATSDPAAPPAQTTMDV